MARLECFPPDDPESNFLYCPSYPAAIAFATLFGLVTVAHTVQACLHKKPFLWVLIMGGVWETVGYAFRILSVIDQKNDTYSIVQTLAIILAPLWINAFCYMCLGRVIHCFLPPKKDKVFGVRARLITLMFVLGDVIAFLVQATGGTMIDDENGQKVVDAGIKIYVAGVGVQLFFIAVFIGIAIRFQLSIRRGSHHTAGPSDDSGSALELDLDSQDSGQSAIPPPYSHQYAARSPTRKQIEVLLYALYTVLLLIVFRNLYRLVEFSAGAESSITKHEYYTFIFDSAPMLLAFLVFNIFHPGRFLHGPRANFSQENRERKAAKKEIKEQRKAAKQDLKTEKRADKIAKKELKAARKA